MYFLIDFENVKNLGLRGAEELEQEDGVAIFFSDSNSRVERRYLQDIEESGCTFDAYKLVKPYKNALDFYIAAKSGELFGGGYPGVIAIISKDEGFKAVRDYWTYRAKPTHRMVVCESIERAILAAGGPYPRVRRISAKMTSLGVEEFYASITDRRKVKEMLNQQFADTQLAERIDDLEALIQKSETPRELYLNALRGFGRNDGLFAYGILKERINFDIGKKLVTPDDEVTQALEDADIE